MKKLTKKALKAINGGVGNECAIKCFCFDPDGGIRIGIVH